MRIIRGISLALAVLVLLSAAARSDGVVRAGPSLTAAPTVTGTAAVGRRLTALTGTWTTAGAPAGPRSDAIDYGFQWYRCDGNGARCKRIYGATGAGYRLAARDLAKTIGVTVSATDRTGTATAHASLVGPVARPTPLLVSTSQPRVSGQAVQGSTVRTSTGAWSPTPAKITYAWLRCDGTGRVCGPIAAATGSSYIVAGADVGHVLVALVQATFGSTTQSAFSTGTAPIVAAEVLGPKRVAGPTITGTEAQGRQLTASPGTWSGAEPITFAYRWYRCDQAGAGCIPIQGSTKPTYTLVARDVTKTIGLRLEATDTTGVATTYGSLVGPIAASPSVLIATGQPAITGDPRRGQRLAVSPGTWSPAPTSVAYAWQRCNANGRVCSPIPGATASMYVVTAEDIGHALIAIVTASSAGGTQSAFSTAIAVP